MGTRPWFQRVKSFAEKVPGAFELYKFITSRTGEGKVYDITQGPMSGVRWKRYNSLPYWYHLGVYEPPMSEYIGRHLPVNGSFWDIGANAGYHTIMGARAVGEHGVVIAVEPDPNTCAILREQLQLNQINHVTIVQAAVADQEGTITFFQSARDSRISAIEGMGIEGTRIEVPMTTLDSLLQLYRPPDMLKMDIEGAEIRALPGGEAVFSSSQRPKHVLIGVHGDEAKRFSAQFLRDHGYTLVQPPGFEDDVTLVGVAN
jgi:FkbM family methyltransferase